MTKKDLMTGDIIVTRGGYLGVILKEEETVLYQTIGADMLSDFNDDLTFDDEKSRHGDIMQVYRGSTFYSVEYDSDYPIYQRDFNWEIPSAEEIKRMKTERDEERLKEEEAMKTTEKKPEDKIFIIAQQFYGNRTGTEISREDAGCFLKGILAPELFSDDEKSGDIRMVKVPGSENIVIVYDQQEEDYYVNVEFPEIYKRDAESYKEDTGRELKMHVSCEIPEIGFKIHTRCFACRVDENGVLQSLEDGDGSKFIKYFTAK